MDLCRRRSPIRSRTGRRRPRTRRRGDGRDARRRFAAPGAPLRPASSRARTNSSRRSSARLACRAARCCFFASDSPRCVPRRRSRRTRSEARRRAASSPVARHTRSFRSNARAARRSASRSAAPRTPSAGRARAEARAASPKRSWRGSSCRVERSSRANASRASPNSAVARGPSSTSPRAVARIAGDELPPDIAGGRGVPRRAGRIQGRLGARRSDPVARGARARAATVHVGASFRRSPRPSAPAGAARPPSAPSSSSRSRALRSHPRARRQADRLGLLPRPGTAARTT